ncbi:iron chelate uptake ABC transporter family permease subunit [Rhizobium sp. CSW-27]|nr:iron chelate uptake ABC transporter family permease subunit [Rhizobium sp. CSW-27]
MTVPSSRSRPHSHPPHSPKIDFGRAFLTVRLLSDRLSWRLDGRALILMLVLLGLTAALAGLSLLSGKYPIALDQVLWALAGKGEDMVRMIVVEWRLPRVALAILLGAALGTSGAIFQSLTRNPLGSPDIIGFSAGSYTGALMVILIFSGGYYETALGALAGGIITATAVYLLAWRQGVEGFRLIVVGIGVAAMLSAFNAWMIREADLAVAMAAAIWGAGSLNGLGTEQLLPVALMLCVLLPLTLFLSRPMRQLELGEDAALASGVDAGRTRLLLMVLGVALTALVTASAGPISFIALCAPQIARRMTRSAGVALLPSALTGGLMLLAADWAAQHALGVQLPVGVMTVSIGGVYFLWLLIREGRK